MNRVLLTSHLPSGPVLEEIYSIHDSRVLEHFQQTLKIKVGTNLKVIFKNHGVGIVIVESIHPQQVNLLLTRFDPFQQQGHLVLAVAFSRPPTMKKILEHAIGFGVGEFHIFPSELSDRSYEQSPLWKGEEYQRYLQLGLEQSGHYTQEPLVKIYSHQRSFLETFSWSDRPCFLLSPHCQKTFMDYPQALSSEKRMILIGPERGFTQKEENQFLEVKKCLPVCISKGLLRVEMAAFASLAQLEMLNLKSPTN